MVISLMAVAISAYAAAPAPDKDARGD
jgi:hypothetical protein